MHFFFFYGVDDRFFRVSPRYLLQALGFVSPPVQVPTLFLPFHGHCSISSLLMIFFVPPDASEGVCSAPGGGPPEIVFNVFFSANPPLFRLCL